MIHSQISKEHTTKGDKDSNFILNYSRFSSGISVLPNTQNNPQQQRQNTTQDISRNKFIQLNIFAAQLAV